MFPARCLFALLCALSALTAASWAATDAPGDRLLQDAHALADELRFDEAAAAYEQLARSLHDSRVAPQALAAAAVLRLGLGQLDQARVDAALLQKTHGEKHPDLVAHVTLARARRHAGLLEWEPLRALLAEALPALDRRGPLDARLQAHALLGRALERLGRHREAAGEHRRVLALAKGAKPGEPGADAVGEAHFFFAEEAREAAVRFTLRPYDGPGERKAVLAYLNGPTSRWLARKIPALEAAERAYLRVFGVEMRLPLSLSEVLRSGGDPNAPTAPWGEDEAPLDPSWAGHAPAPRWAVAAAARVGLGWGELAKEIRSLPVPPLRPFSEDVWGAYQFSAVEPGEVPQARAKRACQTCLRLAAEHGIADEYTEACDAWLGRNYRVEHRAVEELWPRIAAPPAVGVFEPARRFP